MLSHRPRRADGSEGDEDDEADPYVSGSRGGRDALAARLPCCRLGGRERLSPELVLGLLFHQLLVQVRDRDLGLPQAVVRRGNRNRRRQRRRSKPLLEHARIHLLSRVRRGPERELDAQQLEATGRKLPRRRAARRRLLVHARWHDLEQRGLHDWLVRGWHACTGGRSVRRLGRDVLGSNHPDRIRLRRPAQRRRDALGLPRQLLVLPVIARTGARRGRRYLRLPLTMTGKAILRPCRTGFGSRASRCPAVRTRRRPPRRRSGSWRKPPSPVRTSSSSPRSGTR